MELCAKRRAKAARVLESGYKAWKAAPHRDVDGETSPHFSPSLSRFLPSRTRNFILVSLPLFFTSSLLVWVVCRRYAGRQGLAWRVAYRWHHAECGYERKVEAKETAGKDKSDFFESLGAFLTHNLPGSAALASSLALQLKERGGFTDQATPSEALEPEWFADAAFPDTEIALGVDWENERFGTASVWCDEGGDEALEQVLGGMRDQVAKRWGSSEMLLRYPRWLHNVIDNFITYEACVRKWWLLPCALYYRAGATGDTKPSGMVDGEGEYVVRDLTEGDAATVSGEWGRSGGKGCKGAELIGKR